MNQNITVPPWTRRLFVFAIRERQKVYGVNLYRGTQRRGMMSRAEDLWIINISKGCRGWHDGDKFNPWVVGQRVLVSDAFELEPIQPCDWDNYSALPEFSNLARMAEMVEGRVCSAIIHEDSILSLCEDSLRLQETENARDGMR